VAFVSEQIAQRTGTGRWLVRTAGIGLVAAACLGAVPGIAAAKPTSPSSGQISAAQKAAADAAAQMGAISAQLATAKAKADDAHAHAALALDQYEGKQEEYDAAQKAAKDADAAAEQAKAELAAARAAVASFARTSYMSGSTDAGMQSLMSAGSPAQMLERAALLEAAGNHRSNVVVQVTVAEQKAETTVVAAKDTLTKAATLKEAAAGALAAADALESSARQEQSAFQTQQAQQQASLDQARQTLTTLEGEKAAADTYNRQQAAAASAATKVAAPAPSPRTADSAPAAGPGSSSAAETAIRAAERWIGTRYAWGGGSLSGPSEGIEIDKGVIGFDCSGLTRYAYYQAGISIPRQSTAQYAALPKVSKANLQRGDLVFYAFDTSDPSSIHHVAIYLGNGRMIEAPESGETVHETAFRTGGFIGGARPSA
jgi:cell wall-associated NlpC family hydrolase